MRSPEGDAAVTAMIKDALRSKVRSRGEDLTAHLCKRMAELAKDFPEIYSPEVRSEIAN